MRADRASKMYLIPTLAFHLLQLDIPALREAILESIEAHPSVFDKRLDQQVKILLLEPIRKLRQAGNALILPKVIVVDGVDECASDDGRTYEDEDERQRSRDDNHCEVLSALLYASDDKYFPFLILIASRPERTIEQYLSSRPTGTIKNIFLDDKYEPWADIELYARAMLTKIGMDYGLGETWYSQVGFHRDVPRYLAVQSSGQFVYVATIIRYLQHRASNPHDNLKHVLHWQKAGSSNPFSALDALYAGILQTSPKPLLSATWMGAIGRMVGTLFLSSEMIKAILESYSGDRVYPGTLNFLDSDCGEWTH